MNDAHCRRINGFPQPQQQQFDRIVLRQKLEEKYAQGMRNSRSRSHEASNGQVEELREVIYLSRSKFKASRELHARNPVRRRFEQVNHFSHRHSLRPFEVEEEDGIICSGCELGLVGAAYGCLWCNFFLHKSCFELPRELLHRSHPKHNLKLLPTPAYKEVCAFSCNACGDYGGGFVYHCATCKFDLHVDCAYLPRSLDCKHHQHPLTLFYSFPYKNETAIFCCDICGVEVDKYKWIYYCLDCDYGAHVGCATAEGDDEEEEDDDNNDTEGCTDEEPGFLPRSTLDRMRNLRI